MSRPFSQTPLPYEWNVYALTENGREIRTNDDESLFWVQPRYDNYWICCHTPEEARAAFRSGDFGGE